MAEKSIIPVQKLAENPKHGVTLASFVPRVILLGMNGVTVIMAELVEQIAPREHYSSRYKSFFDLIAIFICND